MVEIRRLDEVFRVDCRVEDFRKFIGEDVVLLYQREIVNVDLPGVLAVDDDRVRHPCRHLLDVVKNKSIRLHQCACTIGLQKLVRVVAVEEDFAIAASEQRDRERDLIKHVVVKGTSEENDPDCAQEHSDVSAKRHHSAANGLREPAPSDLNVDRPGLF